MDVDENNPQEDDGVILIDDAEAEASKKSPSSVVDRDAVFINLDIGDDEWFQSLPDVEKKFYQKNLLDEKSLEESSIVCTSCFRQINHKQAGAVMRHPHLGVPVCKQCRAFYYEGDWTKDDEGYYEFCRWCANGGDLLCCDTCKNVFCKKCIKRNLGRVKVSEIEESDDWRCLMCDTKQIWKQRSMYHSLWCYQKTIREEGDQEESGSGPKPKKTFLDDALKDANGVLTIFSDYIEKAGQSWKKKAKDRKDEDSVKMVKKLRTIIQVTRHNLKLLDDNIVSGFSAELDHLDEDDIRVSVPETETTQDEHESQPVHRNDVEEEECNTSNPGPDQSRDMFEDSNDDSPGQNCHSNKNDESLNEANKRAREAVLRSSSSDSEDYVNQLHQEESPRKKLKTKKERDELRRKSNNADPEHSEVSDQSPEEDSEDGGNSSDDVTAAQSLNILKKSKVDKGTKLLYHKLNLIASKVDINSNRQLKQKLAVNLEELDEDVKDDLKVGSVDVSSYSQLVSQCGDKGDDRDIDRLCDLKSLTNRRGSSEYDSINKESSKSYKPTKKKQIGLGDISSNSDSKDSDQEEGSSDEGNKFEGFKTENDLAKSAVLAETSEEDDNVEQVEDSEEDKPPAKEKKKREKKDKEANKDNGGDKPKKKKQLALLTMKLSESDSSEGEAKYRRKMERKNAAGLDSGDSGESHEINTELSKKNGRKKSKPRKAIISSDDENGLAVSSEDSNDEGSNYEDEEADTDHSGDNKKKRKKRVSSSDEDSDSDDKPKRRKRIRGGDSETEGEETEEASPSKAGRHEIRKVIKDKHLSVGAKEAVAEERERRKRIEERQSLYNKSFALPDSEKEGTCEKLVLDFDPETMEVLVEVNKRLVKKLKPHQIGGVKFMWDACFESLQQIRSGKTPGGAILAHCMGLGKTLQTVTLTHTVLDNKRVGVSRVMVICPVNTVKNWQDEYEKWLTGELELDVYEMSREKDNWGRADRINQWFREGGVLIIGYEMFRNLVNEKNKKFKKKQTEIFNRCLLDPGPDLVVCDEGHLLKNEKSAINKAVNRITTPRRIVLTGTPLQNNLKEYFEMVNFVKPLLMGTRKEFLNRFVNPIVNGQHADSTDRDVRIMKKRSFILNDLLKGCMQRLDYNVLVPYLQPKHEYVLSISLTDLQKKLYKHYLENFAKAGQVGDDGKLEGGKKGGLFYDVQQLSRIWNHPFILELAKQRRDEKEEENDEEGSLKDFICDDEDEDIIDSGNEDSDADSDIQEVDINGDAMVRKSITRSSTDDAAGSSSRSWWNHLMSETDQLDDIHFGNKMVLLMDILKECAMIGDKVLVFSQSLLSLDLIEEFLARINEAHESSSQNSSVSEYLDSWLPGKDYYRMDGSTAPDTRKMWCKYFNKATNDRMRLFLISTKAGGLGINLVAANRVVVFDASWNPSHDVQSIFRVFRFGQKKPVYIYRFLGKGTMEEKIYERQVTKQSLSARVVDEQQIERHFTMNELSELYEFKEEPQSARPTPEVPKDRLLAELLEKHKTVIWSVSNHDSLLEHQVDQNLDEAERKAAWEEYEQEKKGVMQTNVGIENTLQFGAMIQNMLPKSGDGRIMASPINPMAIQQQLKQMNPELSHDELVGRTRAAILQLQNLHRVQTPVILNENTMTVGQRQTTGYDQSYYQAEMAKAKAMINNQYPGMYRFGFRGPSPGNVRAPGLGRAGPSGEVITLDGPSEAAPGPMMRMPMRAPVPAPRGGGRGRGGRRGRPRLDPDTDLDFSPEPSSASNEIILARLQQAGLSLAKKGNES